MFEHSCVCFVWCRAERGAALYRTVPMWASTTLLTVTELFLDIESKKKCNRPSGHERISLNRDLVYTALSVYFQKSVLIFMAPFDSDTALRISVGARIISYGRSDYRSYGTAKKKKILF